MSSSTVATHRLFEPDIGGVSSGSMMMNPICAAGCFGGTRRFTWRNTPPRGSFSTKLRSRASRAMNRDCSQSVSPGGGATPPTMTSPTSPSACALTTWMTLLACISLLARRLDHDRGGRRQPPRSKAGTGRRRRNCTRTRCAARPNPGYPESAPATRRATGGCTRARLRSTRRSPARRPRPTGSRGQRTRPGSASSRSSRRGVP